MNDKLLNNTFMALVFVPPAFITIAQLLMPSDPRLGLSLFASLLALCGVISNLVIFIMDYRHLNKVGAHCPSWGWVFLQPVYIWKRLKGNNLPMHWFGVYMVCHLVIPRLARLVH